MIKSSFSRNLKKLREENNLTKADMARKIGIPYTTYNGYEEALREPKFETIELIAELFNKRAFDMVLTKTEYIQEETAEFLISLCGYRFTPIRNDNEFLIQEIENSKVKRGVNIDITTLNKFVSDVSDYTTFSLNKILDKK